MTRDEVFALIRTHLADELEIDPARIEDSTRFKEDLEADSLDLYTLVQELEDSYGVQMSDEEAAKILTVGQAVDFVLAHAAVQSHLSPETSRRSPRGAARRSAPAGLHARLLDRAPQRLLRPPRVPRRLRARPGDHRRTCTRVWRPSATAPAA